MTDDRSSKTLKTVIAVLFFSLMTVVSVRFVRGFMFGSNWEVFEETSEHIPPYKQYKSTMLSASPDSEMAYFRLEDLNGAMFASVSGAEGGTHYSLTIVLGSTNENDVRKFQQNKDLMASIVRDTVSSSRPEHLSSEDGRQYLKFLIRERIVRAMDVKDIDAVYFEKILFQPAKD